MPNPRTTMTIKCHTPPNRRNCPPLILHRPLQPNDTDREASVWRTTALSQHQAACAEYLDSQTDDKQLRHNQRRTVTHATHKANTRSRQVPHPHSTATATKVNNPYVNILAWTLPARYRSSFCISCRCSYFLSIWTLPLFAPRCLTILTL